MSYLSPRIKWILKNISGHRILDVGFAGSGNEQDILFQTILTSFPNKYLAGVDINKKKVEKLDKKNTFVGDGRALSFKAHSFDCIVLAEVLEHSPNPQDFFKEAHRVLKSGGQFLVTTPNPYGLFRWAKNYLIASNLALKKNVRDFLGDSDHKVFHEPLSVINLLYEVGFAKVEFETTNPSYPYLPKSLKERQLSVWPFNRLGTYSCYKAIK